MKKLLALLLAALMLFSVIGAVAEETAEAAETVDTALGTPLVVTTSEMNQKFSPFFWETAYDKDVQELTQIGMMTTDRTGGIIYNGIEGETHSYNGTDYTYYGTGDLSVDFDEEADITTYTYKMRDDLVFSDGVPVTIDDVIFTYYVVLDPAYVGANTLNSESIIGLQAYRTQIPEANLDEVNAVIDAVKAAGAGYTAQEGDPFTQEAYDAYWNKVEELWKEDAAGMIDLMYEGYAPDYAEMIIGKTADEIGADEGLKAAFAMALWGFGSTDDEFATLTGADGQTFDLAAGQYPTADDYFSAAFAAYEGDFQAYIDAGESELGATADPANAVLSAQVAADMDIDTSAGVPNISGITRIDDYTVEVRLNGFSAPAVYNVLDQYIVPMHYYGDADQYDYENNQFGHPFGDLSLIQAKTAEPMGAGPYKFIKYENRVVYYEANDQYFLGAPEIKSFQYKETQAVEVASAVQTGTADGGEMTGSKSNFELLRSFNSNGELTGDVVTTYSVANLGYGYIGINAKNVNVAGDPGSDASKNLRKAFATVLSVYRDTAIDSYYGDAAAVINYPISTTSWAAPQATDEGYRVAFSQDVEGNDIYTADMTQEQKYEAALQAAIGYLKAAGYTFDEATGKFTEAPEGASLSYEIMIPADGVGDHPAFAIITDAHNALEAIGIDLKINDLSDSSILWDTLNANQHEMWCAAWGASIDPDMYQVYHSSNGIGLGGTDSNNYNIASEKLDQLIMDARMSADQDYRKQVYKAALDEIIDWAVEIPTYQRQNIIIASSQRIDTSTVTPDITTYWGWLHDVETMQMAQAAE